MKNSSRIASLVVCVLVCQPSIVTGVRMEDEDSRLHLNAGACPTSVATKAAVAAADAAVEDAKAALAAAEAAAAKAQAADVAAAKLESDCNTCVSDRSQYWESDECKTDDAYRTRFFVRVWTSNDWYAGTNWLPSVQLFEGDDHVSKKVQIGKANDDHDDFEAGSEKTYMVDLDHKMKPDKFCISFPGTGDKWLPEKINLYNNGPYDVYMKDWDWFTKEETQCKDITDIRMTDPDR